MELSMTYKDYYKMMFSNEYTEDMWTEFKASEEGKKAYENHLALQLEMKKKYDLDIPKFE